MRPKFSALVKPADRPARVIRAKSITDRGKRAYFGMVYGPPRRLGTLAIYGARVKLTGTEV